MTKFIMNEDEILAQIYKSMTNHTPNEDQIEAIEEIRKAYKGLASTLITHAPASRERSVAVTELETSLMWATKSVILNPLD